MYLENSRDRKKIGAFLTKIGKEGPIAIYLFAFLIPFYEDLMGQAVALLFLEQWIRWTPIKKAHLKTQVSWRNPGMWLFLFYLMHVVGLFYTENMSYATLDLGMKASFAILPLFFFLYTIEVDWKVFVKAFVLGALFSILLNLLLSMENELTREGFHIYYISSSQLSHFMHRGYWAIYLIIAYFFLLQLMLQLEKKKGKKLFSYLIGAFVILVFVVLSGSKMGMILLFLVSCWAIIKLFRQEHKKWIPWLFVLIFVGGVASSFLVYPGALNRVKSSIVDTLNTGQVNEKHPGSTELRIMVWQSSLELIQANFWWGVGTGDVKDELIQKNYENGYVKAAKSKLNCHNQFLNSQLDLGILASIFLLMAFLTNLLKSPYNQLHSWRRVVIAILFLAMLTESMLETQAGIIPYAFLLCFMVPVRGQSL